MRETSDVAALQRYSNAKFLFLQLCCYFDSVLSRYRSDVGMRNEFLVSMGPSQLCQWCSLQSVFARSLLLAAFLDSYRLSYGFVLSLVLVIVIVLGAFLAR